MPLDLYVTHLGSYLLANVCSAYSLLARCSTTDATFVGIPSLGEIVDGEALGNVPRGKLVLPEPGRLA